MIGPPTASSRSHVFPDPARSTPRLFGAVPESISPPDPAITRLLVLSAMSIPSPLPLADPLMLMLPAPVVDTVHSCSKLTPSQSPLLAAPVAPTPEMLMLPPAVDRTVVVFRLTPATVTFVSVPL